MNLASWLCPTLRSHTSDNMLLFIMLLNVRCLNSLVVFVLLHLDSQAHSLAYKMHMDSQTRVSVCARVFTNENRTMH